ncbi:hypothetical protein ACWEKM_42885 [Streptomyces sp. NPDC004752]
MVEGDAGGWHINRDALTDAIRARRSGLEIDSMRCSEVRSLVWQFKTENGPGEAYLHEDGTCLYTDVWEEDAIWLAIVFRRLSSCCRSDLERCPSNESIDWVVAGCSAHTSRAS